MTFEIKTEEASIIDLVCMGLRKDMLWFLQYILALDLVWFSLEGKSFVLVLGHLIIIIILYGKWGSGSFGGENLLY